MNGKETNISVYSSDPLKSCASLKKSKTKIQKLYDDFKLETSGDTRLVVGNLHKRDLRLFKLPVSHSELLVCAAAKIKR